MCDTLLNLYGTVMKGVECTVRGQKVINVRNLAVVMEGRDLPCITSFDARGLNLDYAKKEWLWFLGADKYDDSICKHATMWQKLKQPDGSFYSNYGQYMFGRNDNGGKYVSSQFDYVVNTLATDENSRRASMVLLNRDHLFAENSDVVCTYAINFTIENTQLHMTVMMRSNDVIFGFTNDAFCFSQLFEFVYLRLKDEHYGWLKRGTYTHFTNSMHVYERHFDMIERIVRGGPDGHYELMVPSPTADEVRSLVNSGGKDGSGPYVDWLKA
jgi:thymidylate synthase